MKHSILSSILLLAIAYATAAAAATSQSSSHCLTDAEAKSFSDNFDIINTKGSNWQTVAQNFLADDFTYISDSDQFLRIASLHQPSVPNIQLNSTTASSRAEYIANVISSLPPASPTKTLFLAHTCDTITTYKQFIVNGNPGIPIRGIGVMFIDLQSRKAKKNYWENNSAAVIYGWPKPAGCEEGFQVGVGNSGPAFETKSCEKK